MIKKQATKLRLTIVVLLFLVTFAPVFTTPSYASVPSLEHIRVSLFIDARGVVPSVTLSSATALQIGVRHPSGVNAWLSHNSNQPLRASIDQYKIHITETNDVVQANNIAQQINGLAGEAYVVSGLKSGHVVYRVYTGQFSNEAQALVALNRLNNETQLKPYELTITGPLHWNAGTYNSKEAALDQLSAISHSGLTAYLVYSENAEGHVNYAVWLGEAANAKQLEEAKVQATHTMPSLNLQAIDATQPYLILKEQRFANGQTLPHYYFNATGQQVWISADSGIQVLERSNRTYRGSIELSQYKGSMAVINEVPFEHYLYAVVGSEVSATWPTEALKAQAVVARTYALKQGMKYGIAHVSDTTFEQAYYGIGSEYPAAIAAVQATAGEVVVDQAGRLIDALYYSNAGGMTAATNEIWGTALDYITVVPSPDQIAEDGKLMWNRVVLPDGLIGYVRSDYTRDSGEVNRAGYPIFIATETGVNVRSAPFVNNSTNPSIGQLNAGDRLILFEQTLESNAFSWTQGPFTAEQLQSSMTRVSNTSITDLRTLEVTQRGPSGRVTELKANGQPVSMSVPDNYRAALNGLQSTRFDVEETGRYTVLGANGQREFPEHNASLYVLSGSEGETSARPVAVTSTAQFVMNGDGETRLITKDPQFRFIGLGFGHGIGMSQWGARELAEFVGYDYKQIIKYYYTGVSIVKG